MNHGKNVGFIFPGTVRT